MYIYIYIYIYIYRIIDVYICIYIAAGKTYVPCCYFCGGGDKVQWLLRTMVMLRRKILQTVFHTVAPLSHLPADTLRAM